MHGSKRAGPVVPHGSRVTRFQTARYRRFNVFWVTWKRARSTHFYILEFGVTELNATFETTAVSLPGQIDLGSARQ